MGLPQVVRVATVLVFVATGGYSLVHCLATRPSGSGRVGRLNDLVHLLMSGEMAVMAWFGGLPDRWGAQAAVFAVATGWFLVQAVPRAPVALLLPAPPRPPWPPSCAVGPARLVYGQYALAAAVMTWMLLAMPAPAQSTATGAVHGSTSTGSTATGPVDLGPVDVGSAHPAGMGMPDTAPHPLGAALLGGCLLVSAAWWLVAGYRARAAPPGSAGAGPVPLALSHALMAAGMAAVLLAAR